MNRITTVISATLSIAMLTSVAACGSSQNDSAQPDGIYYLNNKPEIAQSMQDLAAKYSKETGVSFTVQTAASGTYQQSLKSELAKSQPPTLF